MAHIRGTLSEPVRRAAEIELSLWPDVDWQVGTIRPAGIGHITSIRAVVPLVASFPPADFEHIWMLALSGCLQHAYLSFTQPH